MTPNFPKWPLFAALLFYFALTAALIARIPLGASPDEAAHWQYVDYLVQNGKLPVFKGQIPPAPGYEFHQPPLYYALCAPLWKMAGAGVQNYLCRAVSLVCGLLTIWVIWNAARLVFPSNWRIAGLAAGLSALWPLHQGIGAGSNNDGLGGLLCALMFFLVARLWRYGCVWRDVLLLGLVSGLGILTKNTTLSVAAASFGALFFAARGSENQNTPRPILAVGAAILLMFLVGGPLLARNHVIYGDALAQGVFKATFRQSSPGPQEFAQIGIDSLDYFSKFVTVAFCTTWGFFGGPNAVITATKLFSPRPILPQIWLVPFMALFFALPFAAIVGWRKRDENDEEDSTQKAILASFGVGILLVALAWAQFGAQYFAGAQARYGHGALLPICILLAAGWARLWGNGRALGVASTVVGASLVFLTLLNVFVWKTLV
ncbi:MAG TPA: glycosyltransferase family 39 protein [Abditibacterium sp.]